MVGYADADTQAKSGPLCNKSHRTTTPVTDLTSVPQITKFILTQPLRAVNNTIRQTQMRLRKRHPHRCTILLVKKRIRIKTVLEHTRTIKLLSCPGHDTNAHGCLRHNFTQMSLKLQHLESKRTLRIRRLIISLTAIDFIFPRFSHVPLEVPGVNCY